jgi:hypothetical protein
MERWTELANQAVDLLAHEAPPVQLGIAVGGLFVVALMLHAIASLVRRGERAWTRDTMGTSAPRTIAWTPPSPAKRGSPHRRAVHETQPARTPRPKVKRRGESGYIGDYVLTVPAPAPASGTWEQTGEGIGNWRE